MEVILERFKHQKACNVQTIGKLFVYNNEKLIYTCFTLEPPDFNNEKNKSCIPIGEYDVVKRRSASFENHFHILDVPNRDYILIHFGNYFSNSTGCILTGDNLSYINNDGYVDVSNSKQTMKKLNEILPNNFKLKIL